MKSNLLNLNLSKYYLQLLKKNKKVVQSEVFSNFKLKKSKTVFNYIDLLNSLNFKKFNKHYNILIYNKFIFLLKQNKYNIVGLKNSFLNWNKSILKNVYVNIFKTKNNLLLFFSKNNNIYKVFQTILYKVFYGELYKYFIKLKLNGMGFKASLNIQLKKLKFSLGFSHKSFKSYSNKHFTNILIFNKSFKGVSILIRSNILFELNDFANKICLMKKVDPYKHKGFILENVLLKKKRGKKQAFLF